MLFIISQEVLDKIRDKSITENVFKTQDDDSMCEFWRTAFVEYVLSGKTLLKLCQFIFSEWL